MEATTKTRAAGRQVAGCLRARETTGHAADAEKAGHQANAETDKTDACSVPQPAKNAAVPALALVR
jgi:hypothetical protein